MKRMAKNGKAASGVVNNLLAHLPIWKYTSTEGCKQQLLAVFKADGIPNEYLISQAVESRKKEVKWPWLYFPFVLFGFSMLYLICIALIWPGTRYAYTSIVTVFMLAFVFRITFYNTYLDICKNLVLAADGLLRDVPARAEDSILPVLTERTDEMTAIQGMTEEDREEFLELAKAVSQWHGKICVILMAQSLRRGCGRPSIYDNFSPPDIESFATLIGCVAKNVKDKMKDYQRWDKIKLTTEKSKTTHLRYARILQKFYKQRNDSDLHDAAKKLHAYISGIKIPQPKE